MKRIQKCRGIKIATARFLNPMLLALLIIAKSVTAIDVAVGSTGAASFNLPIEIPPGNLGMEPKDLTIQYSSSAGNGPLGVGMMLTGVHMISRISFEHQVMNDTTDTFASSLGGRLVDISGNKTAFHTQAETWGKYVPQGDCGGGPCFWTMVDKDGTQYEFGKSTDSKVKVSTGTVSLEVVSVWMLSKVQDQHGNSVEYEYEQAEGIAYLSQILYTLGNGKSSHHRVVFEYQKDRLDHQISYASGSYTRSAWLLSGIKTGIESTCFLFFSCTDILRRYSILYENSAITNRSRVRFITEYAQDDTVLQQHVIGWQNGKIKPEQERDIVTQAGGEIGNSKWLPLSGDDPDTTLGRAFRDVNGDGKADYCRWIGTRGTGKYACKSGADGSQILLASQMGHELGTDIGSPSGPNEENSTLGAALFDIDVDGKLDFCRWTGASEYSYKCALHGKASDVTLASETAIGSDHNDDIGWNSGPNNESSALGRSLADVSGDGKLDFCRWTGYYEHLAWNGYGWHFSYRCELNSLAGNQDIATRNDGDDLGWGISPDGDKSAVGRAMVDVNGDGKADFCRWINDRGGRSYVCKITGLGSALTLVSKADGHDLGIETGPNKAGSSSDDNSTLGRQVIDINGDGKADYCRWVGSSGSYTYQCKLTGVAGTTAGDEITLVAQSWGGSGLGYSAGPNADEDIAKRSTLGRQLIDVNGDGLLDYCRWVDGTNSKYDYRCILQGSRVDIPVIEENDGVDIGYPDDPQYEKKDDNLYSSLGRQLTDIDGDGKVDYCRWVGNSGSYSYKCRMSDGAQPDLLASIYHIERKSVTTITYQSASAHTSAISASSSETGVPNASARYLVGQISQKLNIDPAFPDSFDSEFIREYTYSDGRYIPGARTEIMDVGFHTIQITEKKNTGTGAVVTGRSETAYDQSKDFHGAKKSEIVYGSDGQKLIETIYPQFSLYQCNEDGCVSGNAYPRQLRTTLPTTKKFYRSGNLVKQHTESTLSWDTYGNPVHIQYEDSQNGQSRTLHKFLSYVNSKGEGEAVRVIGLPASEKTCTSSTECAFSDRSLVSGSQFVYDSQAFGNVGSKHLLTAKTTYLQLSPAVSGTTENFSYYPDGNIWEKTDPDGMITAITYDDNFGQYPKRIVKTSGGISTTVEEEYSPLFGKKIREYNEADGVEMKNTLDVMGFETETLVLKGAEILAKKTRTRSSATMPQWVEECVHYGSFSNSEKKCEKKTYDSLGRLLRKEFDELVNGENRRMQADYAYLRGTKNINFVTYPHQAQSNAPDPNITTCPTGMNCIQYTYDASDRITLIKDNLSGKRESTEFIENNSLLPADPVGIVSCEVKTGLDNKSKRACKDIAGNTVRTDDAFGAANQTTVKYLFDLQGRLTSAISPLGVTIVEYLGLSKLRKSITEPISGKISFDYHLNPGNPEFLKLKSSTRQHPGNSNSVGVDYTYTSFGRPLKETATDYTIDYTYDETDVTFGKGRPTTLTYKQGGYIVTERYSFNALGEIEQTHRRISHVERTLCANPDAMPCLQVIGAKKDALGRTTEMLYPDGTKTAITYLAGFDHVSKVSHDNVDYAKYSEYVYDVVPHPGKITYANGVETNFSYNAKGLLEGTTVEKAGVQPVLYMDLEYNYNNALHVSEIDDRIRPARSVKFTYDIHERLQKAEYGSTNKVAHSYVFSDGPSSLGNLVTKDKRRMRYDGGKTYPASDELFDAKSNEWRANQEFAWSTSGALLAKGPFRFAYDSRGTMTEAVEKESPVSDKTVALTRFAYDHTGQRFLKEHVRGGVKIITWYLGDGIELREKYTCRTVATEPSADSCPALIAWQATKFVYGPDGKRISSITGSVKSGGIDAVPSVLFALAEGFSGASVTGISAKAFYTFYGAYATVNIFIAEHRLVLILLLLLMAIGLFVWMIRIDKRSESNLSSPPRMMPVAWQPIAAILIVVMASVNCGTGNLGSLPGDLAGIGTPGGSATGSTLDDDVLSELYSGLPTGTVYYSHDHLGSGALVTDMNGGEIFRVAYSEYGEIDLENSGRYNSATGLMERNISQARIFVTAVKYTGQEYDPETGFYYYNARYYDPQLGVFTTQDKEFDKDAGNFAFNRHMYVHGNPIMYTDPTGHFFFIPILIAIFAAIGAAAATIASAAAAIAAVVFTTATLTAVLVGLGIGLALGFLGAIVSAVASGADLSKWDTWKGILISTAISGAFGALSGGIGSVISGTLGATVTSVVGRALVAMLKTGIDSAIGAASSIATNAALGGKMGGEDIGITIGMSFGAGMLLKGASRGFSKLAQSKFPGAYGRLAGKGSFGQKETSFKGVIQAIKGLRAKTVLSYEDIATANVHRGYGETLKIAFKTYGVRGLRYGLLKGSKAGAKMSILKVDNAVDDEYVEGSIGGKSDSKHPAAADERANHSAGEAEGLNVPEQSNDDMLRLN